MGTVETYRSALAGALKASGARPRDVEARPLVVLAGLRDRWAEFTPAWARLMVWAVRRSVRSGWEAGRISGDTWDRVRAWRAPGGSRVVRPGRALTGPEVRRLLAAGDARDRAVVALLAGCGLRSIEVARLRVGDLLPGGSVRILGKGSKERVVPVPASILRYLAPLRRGPVAPSARWVQRRIVELGARAGLGVVHSHDFRRSFVTAALRGGTDPLLVAKLTGHARLDTVRKYDLRDAGDVVRASRATARALGL